MPGEALSVRYVRVLLDAIEHLGAARASFLAAAGWEAKRLEEVEGRLPADEFYRLVEMALDHTGEPRLGLLALEVVRPPSVDLVGQLVAHASTVHQALESQLRLQKLSGDLRRHSLLEDERGVTLRYECPTPPSVRVRRFMAEMHMVGGYRLFRYFVRGIVPLQVNFEHAAPEYASEYTRLFQGVERFEQARTEIVFDPSFMQAGRRYQDEELHRTLRMLAQFRVSRIERGVRCKDRVHDALLAHEAPGKVTMAVMARELGMSERSLRRRLAAEDTSFDAVVNAALTERARQLLSVEGRSIQETAFALGYSDTTAFHRAFKRWTGTTPSAWRNEPDPA